MKRFISLDPKHLKGLSFWFWFRENIAFMNNEMVERVREHWYNTPNIFKQYQDWIVFFILPFLYMLGVVIGPALRKSDAYRWARENYQSTFYNKKNIEYITIMHTLSGGYDGR